MGPQDAAAVELIEVNSHNWRRVAAVAPSADQERFVAPITYYLCLCSYGSEWKPLGITVDGETVGHVMWAVDPQDDSGWIGGLVIDAAHQRRGVGRAAVEALISRLETEQGCISIGLSYQPDNTVARALYASMGFVESGEVVDDEVVARLPLA